MSWAGNAIAGKIRMLGRDVTVQGENGPVRTRGIIDPVHSVSEAAHRADSLPDGYVPPGSYQYFGLPDVDLSQAETISTEDACYLIRRREFYRVGNENMYWWALMLEGEAEDE